MPLLPHDYQILAKGFKGHIANLMMQSFHENLLNDSQLFIIDFFMLSLHIGNASELLMMAMSERKRCGRKEQCD